MSNGVTLSYDPLSRLTTYGSTVQTRFLYDGVEMAIAMTGRSLSKPRSRGILSKSSQF